MTIRKEPLSGLFLAIFLAIYGIMALTNIRFVWADAIMGICAIAAAILWFMDR